MFNPQQFERQVADDVRASSIWPRDAGPARRLDVQRSRLADEKLTTDLGDPVLSRIGCICIGLLHLYVAHLAVRLRRVSIGQFRHADEWGTAHD